MFADLVNLPTVAKIKTGDYVDGKPAYDVVNVFYAVMSASADDINYFGSTDFKTVVLIRSDVEIKIGTLVTIDGGEVNVSKVKICRDFNRKIVGYRCYFV